MGGISERLAQPIGHVSAVEARAAANLDSAQRAAESDAATASGESVDAGGQEGGAFVSVLGAVAAGFNFLTSIEQALTAPLGAIPFPAFPAVRMGDVGLGYPHAHAHPPNLIPPAPPIPFPHMLVLLPIPILSGAARTSVSGLPAGRCGDLGALIWCGGYFPLCEILLGSASVWIEGMRAARVAIDITKHCVFSAPKPSDPPMGPMVGMTISCSLAVQIGGIPLPSLTSLAIAAAFKAVFKAVGMVARIVGGRLKAFWLRVVRRLTASSYIDDLIDSNAIILHGDDAFQSAVRNDLTTIASTQTGRQVLDDIANSGHHVEIHPPDPLFEGPYASAQDYAASQLDIIDGSGPFQRIEFVWDSTTGSWQRNYNGPAHVRGTGLGSSTDIFYDPNPTGTYSYITAGTPSDDILLHELNHGRNNALGRGANQLALDQPGWSASWQDLEEFDTVGVENDYRAERGLPHRNDYTDLP